MRESFEGLVGNPLHAFLLRLEVALCGGQDVGIHLLTYSPCRYAECGPNVAVSLQGFRRE